MVHLLAAAARYDMAILIVIAMIAVSALMAFVINLIPVRKSREDSDDAPR